MIYHFILNPKSGRSKKERPLNELINLACQERSLNYHVYYTTCAGDATNYTKRMIEQHPDERQRFIIVGGDGSLNEMVNACPCNPNVEIGVIPFGSGNDFVRNFANTELFQSIDAQLDGDAVALDLIKCNEYYFANTANIGLDCEVVKEVDKIKKSKLVPPGLSYIVGVMLVFFRRIGTRMRLIYEDGEVVEKQFTLTDVTNGKYCGGGFKTAPLALLNDGLLDICAIDKVSHLSFLRLIGKYQKGTYLENKFAQKIVSYKQAKTFKMEFDEPIAIGLDGEIKGAKTVEFSIVPNGFSFVIPKGSRLLYSSTQNN